MLSTPGIGSGLDVDTIITQLIEVEQLPLLRLETRKAENDVRISGYGQISNTLAALQSSVQTLADTDTFNQFTAVSSNESVFTATAGAGASVSSNTINVINLAAANRLNSGLFAAEDTVVGTGTLNLSSGTNSFSIAIDGTNNTVAQIRDAINAADDNVGITASLLNVDGGTRLILSADSTGLANQLEVTINGDGDGNDTDNAGLSQLLFQQAGPSNMTELQAADDANFEIDGFSVSSASNEVAGVISGVTLTLTGSGSAALNVNRDSSAISGVLSDLVTNYNDFINNLNSLQSTTLSGDNFLLNLERQAREEFSTQVTGLSSGISTVFELGLSFDKEGVLSLDTTQLDATLASDREAVEAVFTQQGSGFANVMDSLLDRYLGSGGLIAGRTDSINENNTFLDDQIIELNERILNTEERLLAQFTALDTLISQLTATSAFLDQQLNSLLSVNQNNNT